jgi:hypothetical protein
MTEIVSLVADLHTVRCGGCKVLVDDPLAVKCAFCGATFDRVVSNHVGLAKRLNGQRAADEGGDEEAAEPGEAASTEELVTVSRSVLSDLAKTLGGIDGAGDAAAVLSGLLESAPAAEGGSGA